MPDVTKFLALKLATEPWPDALARLLRAGEIYVNRVSSLYEAAAILARNHPRPVESSAAGGDYHALLIDLAAITQGELQLLNTLKRHRPLPIYVLPTLSATHRKYVDALALGAIPWEQAIGTVLRASQQGQTRMNWKGSNEFLEHSHPTPYARQVTDQGVSGGSVEIPRQRSGREPSKPRLSGIDAPTFEASSDIPPPDKNPASSPEKIVQLPIVSDVAARYDELQQQPLISEQELKALLGTVDF